MIRQAAAVAMLIAVAALAPTASAHCDTTKGPVITAARAALESGDPKLVLHWVRAEDEPAVTSAFEHTMKVRALGPEAKALADRYFFETLVRIHRAGEGAPYTGLTDREPEPIIAATDRALEKGSAEELERTLVEEIRTGLAGRFAKAKAAKDFAPGDIGAGRTFVSTYVSLTHWVEGVSTVAQGTAEHHGGAADHMAPAQATIEQHDDHGEFAPATPRGELRPLPWILSGMLSVAVLVQGAFLLRRRRHTTA